MTSPSACTYQGQPFQTRWTFGGGGGLWSLLILAQNEPEMQETFVPTTSSKQQTSITAGAVWPTDIDTKMPITINQRVELRLLDHW